MNITGVQKLSDIHSIAFLVVKNNNMRPILVTLTHTAETIYQALNDPRNYLE